jgi:phage gp46-like protein
MSQGERQGDLQTDVAGDLKMAQGIAAIKNDVMARLLTRKRTIIDGEEYNAETTDEGFGSSLYYIIGRKKTQNNIRLAMLYVADALLDAPYLDIQEISAEVFPSKDLNRELVRISIKALVTLPTEDLVMVSNKEEIKVDVVY